MMQGESRHHTEDTRTSSDVWASAVFSSAVLVAAVLLVHQYFKSNLSAGYDKVTHEDGRGVNIARAFPSVAPIISGKRGLLVAMGSCEACSASKYRRPTTLNKTYSYILEVYDSNGSGKPPASSPPFYVLTDRNGVMHRALRAFLPPREYLVSERGTVDKASIRFGDIEPSILAGD